eukprot:scaffold41680_cov37-Prasinocladus_malaysianus.AAC.1
MMNRLVIDNDGSDKVKEYLGSAGNDGGNKQRWPYTYNRVLRVDKYINSPKHWRYTSKTHANQGKAIIRQEGPQAPGIYPTLP